MSNIFRLIRSNWYTPKLIWLGHTNGFWLALMGIFSLVASPMLLEQYLLSALQKNLQRSAAHFSGNLEKKIEAQKKGFSRAILASSEPQRPFENLAKAWMGANSEILSVYLLTETGQALKSATRPLEPSERLEANREYIAQWQSFHGVSISNALELQEAVFTPLYKTKDDAFVNLIIPVDGATRLAYVVTLDAKQWLANTSDAEEATIQISMAPFSADVQDNYNLHYVNSAAWDGKWTLKFQSKDPLFAFMHVLRPAFFTLTWLIAGLSFLYWRNFRLRQKAESELQTKSQILERQSRLSQLGEMSAQLAHEINQPLTSIANYAVAGKLQLQNSGSSATLLPLFQDILDQSQRAAQVLITVRAFLQPVPMEMRTVDVSELIKKLEPSLRFLCTPHRVALQVSYSTALPAVINSILFEQVLFNLVKNSVQSLSESDRPDKWIRLSSELVEGRILIEHFDNGPGISNENTDKIFESFFSTKADGLGIGLSLCRSVIERFNGRLTLKSNSQLGVSFLIDIPFATALPDGPT